MKVEVPEYLEGLVRELAEQEGIAQQKAGELALVQGLAKLLEGFVAKDLRGEPDSLLGVRPEAWGKALEEIRRMRVELEEERALLEDHLSDSS